MFFRGKYRVGVKVMSWEVTHGVGWTVGVEPPSSLWTHSRVQVCGNAKAVGTWGTISTSSTRKG